MHAPVSWLRELADVPADATGADIAASLVKVGLEEEALHGGDIQGPLVVGRVLEVTPEKQKNGKTISWCQVDVGQNGQMLTEGTPAGHRLRRPQLRGRATSSSACCPAACCQAAFEISARKTYGHVSNGMICSPCELGLGDDHAGIIVLEEWLGDDPDVVAAPQARPGRHRSCSAWPTRSSRSTSRPTVATASRCAASRASTPCRRAAPSATPPTSRCPRPTSTGYAVHLTDGAPLDGPPGCDRYVARIVRGVDVTAATPSWMQKRLTQVRDAPDHPGRRRHQLRDDAARPAAARLRPRHAVGLRRRAAGPGRGEAHDARRRRAHARPRGPAHHRRRATPPLAIAGVMGGESSEVSDSTTERPHRGRALRPHDRRPVLAAPPAHHRGVQAVRAGRRPRRDGGGGRAGGRLLVELGGGTPDPGVTDVDHRTAAPAVRLRPGPAHPLRRPGLPARGGARHPAGHRLRGHRAQRGRRRLRRLRQG